MDVTKVVKERSCIRKLKSEEVKREKIEQVLDAVRSPSSKIVKHGNSLGLKAKEPKKTWNRGLKAP